MSPENKETLERLKGLGEDEEREEAVDLEKSRNLLKTREILTSADEIKRVHIEEMTDDDGIPYHVDYCMLNTDETKELLKFNDTNDQNLEELYLRTRKADPDVTREDIRKLPDIFIKLIIMKIRGEENYRFLLPALQRNLGTLNQIRSLDGSGFSATASTNSQPN